LRPKRAPDLLVKYVGEILSLLGFGRVSQNPDRLPVGIKKLERTIDD
jgi:hypothetical protein